MFYFRAFSISFGFIYDEKKKKRNFNLFSVKFPSDSMYLIVLDG